MKENFRSELAKLINRESMENGSDTPDFILAEYLTDCLEVYDRTIRAREKWYGREAKPVPSYEAPKPHIPRAPEELEWRCMVCNIRLTEGDYHVTIMRGDKVIRYCFAHAPAMTAIHLPMPAPEQQQADARPSGVTLYRCSVCGFSCTSDLMAPLDPVFGMPECKQCQTKRRAATQRPAKQGGCKSC